MKKKLRRLFLRWFPRYRRLELRHVNWLAAQDMILMRSVLDEDLRWVIAKEENQNLDLGYVWIERRERIWE